jgi:hypothetical protein
LLKATINEAQKEMRELSRNWRQPLGNRLLTPPTDWPLSIKRSLLTIASIEICEIAESMERASEAGKDDWHQAER